MPNENKERNRLVGLARRALEAGQDAERLKALAGDLFARVSLEDLAVYDAGAARRFRPASPTRSSRERKPDATVIRLADVDADGAPAAGITVLGILNRDMPFLLDSTLAELAASGASLRLVAHPIVNVTRDARRPACRLSRRRADAGRCGPREPHPDPPSPSRRRGAAAGGSDRAPRVAVRRGAARGRRLAADAGPAPRRDRGLPRLRRRRFPRTTARGDRLPRMARRRRFHLPRRARIRLCRRRPARQAAPRRRAGPRHPARSRPCACSAAAPRA